MRIMMAVFCVLLVVGCGPAIPPPLLFGGAGFGAGILIKDKKRKKVFIQVEREVPIAVPVPGEPGETKIERRTLPLPPPGSIVEIKVDGELIVGEVISYGDDFMFLAVDGSFVQYLFDEIETIKVFFVPTPDDQDDDQDVDKCDDDCYRKCRRKCKRKCRKQRCNKRCKRRCDHYGHDKHDDDDD